MNAGPLKLSDDEFWTDPYRTEVDLIHEMAEEDQTGLLFDGPQKVNLDKRTSFPLLAVMAETLRDSLIHPPFRRSAVLVAMRLDRNLAYVDFAQRQRDASRAKRRLPDEDPGEGFSYESFRFNARVRLGLPWRPGTYALCVLRRDVLSNQIQVELIQQQDAFEDPAVSEFLSPRLRDPYPRAVWPQAAPPEKNASNPQPVPWYKPLERTPPIPDEPGIALDMERVVVVEDGDLGCVLYGSFRLKVLAREIVRPCAESTEELETMAAEQVRVDAFNRGEPPPKTEEEIEAEAAEADDPDTPDYQTDDEVDWPALEDPDKVEDPVLKFRARDARAREWTFDDQYAFGPELKEGPRESGHVWEDVGEEGATAVIPITLVATGQRFAEPLVVRLQVPTYDPVKGEGSEVTGQFAVDLLGFRGAAKLRRQTSFVYAFTGKLRAGPCPVALLAPDML